MITWLNPAALFALSAVALPIVIHLLLRARATTVRVPSTRFMVQTREAAVRLRHPADRWLLVIRVATLACAGIALASPLLITAARSAKWLDRTHRAVVVDASASVDAAVAREVAAAQLAGVHSARRFDDPDLEAAVKRAAAWLQNAPPGRLELVVVSDFQAGAATAATFTSVPARASMRMVTVPRRTAPTSEIDGGVVLYGPKRYAQRITLENGGTSYVLREAGPAGKFDFLEGPTKDPAISVLARTVAAAGIFAPPPSVSAVVAATSRGRRADVQDPAAIVVEAPLDSLQAAITVHDALTTRRDMPRLEELEPLTVPSPTIESWSRTSAVGETPAPWQRFDSSDARWFWVLAIVLLAVEAVIRGRRAQPAAEQAHAA